MDYDLKNTILYDYNETINEEIFYMINSFDNYNIRISNIKKHPSNSDYKLVNLDDLRKKHINIIYERKKAKDNETNIQKFICWLKKQPDGKEFRRADIQRECYITDTQFKSLKKSGMLNNFKTEKQGVYIVK